MPFLPTHPPGAQRSPVPKKLIPLHGGFLISRQFSPIPAGEGWGHPHWEGIPGRLSRPPPPDSRREGLHRWLQLPWREYARPGEAAVLLLPAGPSGSIHLGIVWFPDCSRRLGNRQLFEGRPGSWIGPEQNRARPASTACQGSRSGLAAGLPWPAGGFGGQQRIEGLCVCYLPGFLASAGRQGPDSSRRRRAWDRVPWLSLSRGGPLRPS